MLGLIISDMLFRAFPKADEGELSRRLADLVRRETCADVARAIDLGEALRLGASESNAGGRSRTAILADVCEALVGAVFLDGGYAAAPALVERLWGERMRAPARPLRDPKTMLQEWAQARGLPTPAYREVERTGPHHNPEFRVAVTLAGTRAGRGRAAAPSASPSRPPPPPCCSAKACAWTGSMAEPEAAAADGTRCGFIALIGAPNAGKSTLINALVGSKVAIVTPKVQTTRALVRGIAIDGNAQLIFVDTPGIFAPRRRLDRAMVTTAWSGAHDADVVARADRCQARASTTRRRRSSTSSARSGSPRCWSSTRSIWSEKPRLLALAQAANARGKFAATFMVSALTGDGVADLRDWLAAHVPAGPWHYPEDEVSDAPLRQLAAEITREKLYLKLHQELPYQSTVETETWTERKDGSVRIEQTIYVERESQRKIVLGKGGQSIKAIGAAARSELAEILEKPVHLFLFVKVREGWGDDPERYRADGAGVSEGVSGGMIARALIACVLLLAGAAGLRAGA